jgi:Fe-S cluster biosynthesis and repair protein YggX
MPDQNDIQKALLDFSATIKAKPNLSTKEILQKFPEFDNQAFKINAAKDYARTMETKKYKTTEELNSKFPEFFGRGESKKTKSEEIVTPAGLQPGYKFPTIDTSLFQTTPRTIKESVDFGNTNAIDNTKIMDSYPAIKDQYIKDKTINNLLKKGKLPMENSNSWKDEYADVKATTTDEEWVPKNTMVINPEQTKINKDKLLKESIAQFSFNHNEDEKDIEQKIKNGDYVFENGKVKEKGGLSDMYGQDLTSAVDKVDLYLKVAAREADNPGNNNAIKYELKEHFKNKEKVIRINY